MDAIFAIGMNYKQSVSGRDANMQCVYTKLFDWRQGSNGSKAWWQHEMRWQHFRRSNRWCWNSATDQGCIYCIEKWSASHEEEVRVLVQEIVAENFLDHSTFSKLVQRVVLVLVRIIRREFLKRQFTVMICIFSVVENAKGTHRSDKRWCALKGTCTTTHKKSQICFTGFRQRKLVNVKDCMNVSDFCCLTRQFLCLMSSHLSVLLASGSLARNAMPAMRFLS